MHTWKEKAKFCVYCTKNETKIMLGCKSGVNVYYHKDKAVIPTIRAKVIAEVNWCNNFWWILSEGKDISPKFVNFFFPFHIDVE